MMKALLEVKQITLPVSGREMTFSEEELVSILEKHFATKEENTQTAETRQQAAVEVAQTPTEGKWFEVNPMAIDQRLFSQPRDDSQQEWTREIILEAFAKMKNASKYARRFKTMMPEKTWDVKTVSELEKMACHLGGHMADWVEQALQWAQRIDNGATWKAVCNEPDTANWYRLVIWKNGYARLVGGSRKCDSNAPASDVDKYGCYSNIRMFDTVPLVVKSSTVHCFNIFR